MEKVKVYNRGMANWSIVFIPLAVFLCLAAATWHWPMPEFDVRLLELIHRHASAGLDQFFLTITTVGNAEYIAPLTVLIAAYAWYRRRRDQALIIVSGVFGAAAIDFVLKQLFARPRPELWQRLITETSYSFPSGHATVSSALAFSLIALLWPSRWRWYAFSGGLAFMGLVGLSRLYLGVHYPSDILAAWCVSLAWVTVVCRLLLRRPM